MKQKLPLLGRLIKHQIKGNRLKHLTIEVTKRCNAKCSFCSYWEEPAQKELIDYSPIVKKFDPLVVTLSGGEPLLRKNLTEIIKKIRETDPYVYIAMVSNGALLTIEKAESLYQAGLNQLSISLDYAGEKHDKARELPDVYNRIVSMLPQLAGIGFNVVSLNTVIKDDNLEDIPKILDLAREKGVLVGFSSYCNLKTGMDDLIVSEENQEKLEGLISYVREYKKKYPIVCSSDYYLDNVIEYFKNKEISHCKAGINWIQVTPGGEIKPCSEHPVIETDYRKYNPNNAKPLSCTECWYSCRGESQAPITLKRIKELW